MKLIVGLGNPGSRYSSTRHNVGFMVMDELVRQNRGRKPPKKEKGSYQTRSLMVKDVEILIAKPAVFMNESGVAVKSLVEHFDIALKDCLVVVDDVYLPLGTIRLRTEGSSGGHNGLASIIDHLGSSQFPRLRVGVGSSGIKSAELVEYVLSEFSKKEREKTRASIEKAIEACMIWAERGSEAAMARFN